MTVVETHEARRPEAMLPAPFAVTARHRETADTVTLAFEASGEGGFSFRPGQFTMLYVFGVGEVPLSVSGTTAGGGPIHTVRAVGAVTGAICALEPGDVVGVRGPFGTGWPLEAAEGRDLVIAAGGIGLAPLRPVMRHALAHRDRFHSVSLVYGTRSPDDLLYEQELRQWRSRFDVEVEVTVDRSAPGWHGDVGVVTKLLPLIPVTPGQTVAMICGPEIMMRVTARELEARGVARDDIFVSLERNMKCGIGLCGHCQLGSLFVCYDGPVVSYGQMIYSLRVAEL